MYICCFKRYMSNIFYSRFWWWHLILCRAPASPHSSSMEASHPTASWPLLKGHESSWHCAAIVFFHCGSRLAMCLESLCGIFWSPLWLENHTSMNTKHAFERLEAALRRKKTPDVQRCGAGGKLSLGLSISWSLCFSSLISQVSLQEFFQFATYKCYIL